MVHSHRASVGRSSCFVLRNARAKFSAKFEICALLEDLDVKVKKKLNFSQMTENMQPLHCYLQPVCSSATQDSSSTMGHCRLVRVGLKFFCTLHRVISAIGAEGCVTVS